MTASRLAGIPIEHVIAEIAAFPFASIASFELRLAELNPRLDDSRRRDGSTVALWRRAEGALVAGFPAFSLDEVTALRDRVWFADGSDQPIPLHRYLRSLALAFLRDGGPIALPCLPPTDRAERANPDVQGALARSAWRWLSLAVPADLLLSGLGDSTYGPSRVDGLTPIVEKHLMDNGFAETHLHVGAAMDFEWFWALTMAGIGRSQIPMDAFASPGALFDEGRQLGEWLVRAAIGRWLLATFLCKGRGDLLEHLHQSVRPRVEQRLGPTWFSVLLCALGDLESSQLSTDARYTALQGLYSQLARPPAIESLIKPAPLEADPIASSVNASGPRTPEVQFVALALDYLELCLRQGQPDRHFEMLFWQITRVRCLLYRHIVLRPLTPGLQWFVRFYDRGRPGRRSLRPRALLESARQICGGGSGLRSLEVRTAPDSSRSEQQAYIQAVASVAALWQQQTASPHLRAGVPEIGLVLHFIKSRSGGIATGGPAAYWFGTNADPRAAARRQTPNPSGYRYGNYYQSQRQSAMSVEWVLRHRPLSLEILRGFDVCTDEVAVPTWVLVPLLQRVRTAAEDGAEAFQTWFGWCPPLPRTSVHAGEDFVHLLSGMRMLDEAIEGFRLSAGDRIGHGLSLGMDPLQWATRAGMVPVAREDRLFDLLWESQFYATHGGCSDPSRLGLLHRQIPALVEAIFGPGVDAREIEQLREDLFDPWMLYRAGFPAGPVPDAAAQGDPRLSWLISYLTDGATFQRGRTSVWVETASEAASLAALQAELRRKVGRIGITVEVNPTSNLLIGDLNDLTRHPLWRLRPIRPSAGDTPPVPICIGSDDPLVFNSSLPLEYQSLCDAMTLAGYSEEEIRRWISRTRESGMETRFTTTIHSRSILEWMSDARHRPPPPI
jgi:hypothetical protein